MRFLSGAVITLVVCAAAVPVATGAQAITRPTCPVENAQVNVTFSGMDTDVTAARAKLDAKMAEIKGLAQEQQFTELVVQSHNYSISTGYAGAGAEARYQYNGNISFRLQPAEKALDFMQLLAKKGYQTSINVNSYNSYNGASCGQNTGR
jgi:hypothetical protein